MSSTSPDPTVVPGPALIGDPAVVAVPVQVGPGDLSGEVAPDPWQAEKRAETAERRVEAVERALASRAGIDQAKGAIMAVFALDAEAAFDVLVWVSQHANVKLATVADRFLEHLCEVDVGQEPRDHLTRVLGRLGGCSPAG